EPPRRGVEPRRSDQAPPLAPGDRGRAEPVRGAAPLLRAHEDRDRALPGDDVALARAAAPVPLEDPVALALEPGAGEVFPARARVALQRFRRHTVPLGVSSRMIPIASRRERAASAR